MLSTLTPDHAVYANDRIAALVARRRSEDTPVRGKRSEAGKRLTRERRAIRGIKYGKAL